MEGAVESKTPLRFQAAVCAFAFWDCLLLANDCVTDRGVTAISTSEWVIWVAHTVVAGLMCLMTLQKDDLPVPLLRRLPACAAPLQRAIGRLFPALSSPRVLTGLSVYYTLGAVTRWPTSLTPELWFSLFVLGFAVHLLNLFLCLASLCRPGKAAEKKEN
mmetsp:Transcript_81369/g.189011  ORF Transcript_81369/g.189011 Transcript_81369/m.189011 type:complete len:160 (-) Transcript_81369:91-570(-)|eukprot:CAMPEP_0171099378 /NCGR_PEP_ID=MMETSP0766_2-20121228/51350_1 /TAXON_ID=439317 /ORGANISM="Gambierdiscus australes, Strain CAWD 149" /LENGTH=159 /DNA_ID=CAMNT_0011558993 /DNA_START=28 /DNA_END=507 /DNA_ORIENTATION=+